MSLRKPEPSSPSCPRSSPGPGLAFYPEKETTAARAGAFAWKRGSMRTVPVKYSGDPLLDVGPLPNPPRPWERA
jgi:hypothetical protein